MMSPTQQEEGESPDSDTTYTKGGRQRTTRFLRFRPESLLKCPLLFECCEALAHICSVGVAFGAVVLCKDAMSLCIEDEESANRVEGEVEGHG